MEIDNKEYQLRCQLRGHEDDARGICVCGNMGIATSSRDKTVRFWTLDDSNKREFFMSKILLGHTSFVGPLAWISPNEEFPEGGIVSGGMDTLVLVWNLANGEKFETLKGHKLQVTGIALDGKDIVSTSVDCTLSRWRKGKQVEVWEAHKAPIQAVIKLPSGELVTGSSDMTLKLWKEKSCTHTFLGHTDENIDVISVSKCILLYGLHGFTLLKGLPHEDISGCTIMFSCFVPRTQFQGTLLLREYTVRGLAVMPGLGILSASHDGSIRLWALSGEHLMEMVGHTSIVYSVDAHASGLIVSASEDCSAKIWKDGVCVQSIEHPGCVWEAKFLENGDVVTACSDGIVRIWTSNHDKFADTVELDSFASQVSQYKLSRKRVGGLKLQDLPGLDALKIPGNTDGQTKVVREGDNGVAYAWNMREQRWDKIGEVVDGPGDNTNRPLLDGIQYDYVFDVDIGDGGPMRKLPYNRADDPYAAADKWLLKEDLPLSFRQQIVEFILQNTGQKDFTLDPSFRDPYTGSSAYIPGAPSKSTDVISKPSYKHIPKMSLAFLSIEAFDKLIEEKSYSVIQKGMLVFDTAQFDGILKKISEFNNTTLSDPASIHLKLNEGDLQRLNAIVKILKDTSHYHSSRFADVDIALLLKLLKTWPLDILFPAIDVVRMIVLHPDGATKIILQSQDGNDVIVELIKKVTSSPLPSTLLTSLRAVTNLFKNSYHNGWLQIHRAEILDAFSSCWLSANKNVQLSYATLLLNYSVLLIEMKDEVGQSQVLSAALEMAEEETVDSDSRFRALVAIGSLMLEGLVKKVALDFDVVSVARAAKASKETKIAEVGADIELVARQG